MDGGNSEDIVRDLLGLLLVRLQSHAQHIGAADRVGSVEVGKDADLVVLEKDYSVAQTYCMGKAQL